VRPHRVLLFVICFWLSCSNARAGGPPQDTSTPSPNSQTEAHVLLTLSAKNGGRLAAITKADVSVRDDKHPVQVTELRAVKDDPLIFSLVMDISGSMRRVGGSEDSTALGIFKSLAGPGNRGHLVLFNDNLDQGVTDDAMDAASVERELRFHDWRGSTSFYDAILKAVPQLTTSKNGSSFRRLIVVISDGDDDSSHSSFGAALGALQRFGIPLIGVYLHDPLTAKGRTLAEKEALKKFRELCEDSGGMLINDPESAVPTVQNYVASQYLLSFTPSPEAPQDLHMLQVKCTAGDCAVSAPAWYFAP